MADKKTIEEPEQKIKRLEKEIVNLNNMAKKLSTQRKSKKLAMQIQYEEELAMQLKYNTLKANIWKMAAEKSLTENEVIQQILDIAGPILNVSRASFLRFNQVKKNVTAELQWCNEGISSTLGLSIPYSVFKHYSGNDYIKIDSRDTLSDLNQDAITLLKKYGVKSCLATPYCENDNHKGFFTFTESVIDDRDWSESERYILFEIAKIVSARVNQIISDRKRRKLEERLHNAEKMEMLGKLAGRVAHDLNNVLGVLSGYSELLMVSIPEGNPLKEYATHIFQSSGKAAAIVEDLLTLARRGVRIMEVAKFNKIIANLLATPEFDKLVAYHPNVIVRTDLAKDLLNISGSPVHIEKTIFNLVSNAVEAIAGGGEVKIKTENRYIDKAIEGFQTVAEGEYVVLTVSDTGKGIPASEVKNIYEPFYTKKSMGRSGTGLGLAIVQGAVQDHNGYIDVRSTEEKGTTFTLYFPATREKAAAETQKTPMDQYMGHGELVLVVDDVKEQREVATTLLTQLGYSVNAVSSGEDAVEYLKSNKADILVLDMIMEPGIDGLDTYKLVLEINPHQKAVIVSGFSQTDRSREAQKLGAGPYIKKPYMMETIGIAIRDELGRK